MDGSRRPDQNENERTAHDASGNTTDGVHDETPATYGTAARLKAGYGCAIAMRTLQYHSRP